LSLPYNGKPKVLSVHQKQNNMPYNPNNHHRKSIRLKGYDYSQEGLYFITICVQNRECLFGKIENGEMMLNDAGNMVQKEWLKLPQRFSNIELHEFVVMPNHFHAIMEIVGATLVVAPVRVSLVDTQLVDAQLVDAQLVDAHHDNAKTSNHNAKTSEKGQPQGFAPTKPKTVGDIVGAFQSIVTVEYIRGVKNLDWEPFNGKLWQRNYWEHIIRDEQSYKQIAEYIINNPKNWVDDKLHNK
jgi:REP element-mobilizing transposase RayT